MVYVFFWAGTFGSTVEYVIRTFTNEYQPVQARIASDGSMHNMHDFTKINHLMTQQAISKFLNNERDSTSIATIVSPTIDCVPLTEIVSMFKSEIKTSKCILLYVNSKDYAELNRLFQYHKIINGKVHNIGLRSIALGDAVPLIKRWNPSYKSISDMKTWELREWQSLFDFDDFINAPAQVDHSFLKVSTQELLDDTFNTFDKIITWCGLTRNSSDLQKFAADWRQKQQYVLDEHKLIVDITNATINNISMTIPKNLNIFAQAIIQQRLRNAGFEIRCDGLNKLPHNTTLLHNLLDKNLALHQEI